MCQLKMQVKIVLEEVAVQKLLLPVSANTQFVSWNNTNNQQTVQHSVYNVF